MRVYNIGPVLADNLREHNNHTRGREILFSLLRDTIPPGSDLLLCFGSEDCRYHLLKQAEQQKKSYKKIVQECVGRYVNVIKEVKQLGFKVHIWNAVPSVIDSLPMDEACPSYGTMLQRNRTAQFFNTNLKKILKQEEIPFLSIFSKLVDKQNRTKEKFMMDGIHLSQKAMPLALRELAKSFPVVTSNCKEIVFDAVPGQMDVSLVQKKRVSEGIADHAVEYQFQIHDENDFDVISADTTVMTQADGVMKLCLGGKQEKPGWKIYHTESDEHVDYRGDYSDLSLFDNSTVDEVYLSTITAQLDYKDELVRVLKEVHRILKPGGVLRMCMPDFEKLCSLFVNPQLSEKQRYYIMRLMFGNHILQEGESNVGLTYEFVSGFLNAAGFASLSRVGSFELFDDLSEKQFFGIPLALNVEAVKT